MTDVIIPPTIDNSQLIFDEAETREILVFFWPSLSSRLNEAEMTSEFRSFAQSLLIAAIDGSYAMGFMDILLTSVANPRGGLKKLGKKLARRYLQHWWKHTSPKDLEDVKIYESVRATVARNFGRVIVLMLSENGAALRLSPFFVATSGPSQVWV